MPWQDLVNAFFEGGMAFAVVPSILVLYKAKMLSGLHWFHIAFPTVWGFWNLYYYPWLGQWASFWAGLSIVTVNIVYLSMLFYYIRWPGGRSR